jgi:hypothetical protein
MRSTFDSGAQLTIKIEMNTFERAPARPTTTRSLEVNSPWYSNSAEVPTFELDELVATKIRALYQRRKGRDLFDLWLAVEHAGVAPEAIAACFGPYRPDNWTPALAVDNLEAKLHDGSFRTDLDSLVDRWPAGYTVEAGGEVARAVLDNIVA